MSNSWPEPSKGQSSVPRGEESEGDSHTGFLLDFAQDTKESRLHAVAVKGVFPWEERERIVEKLQEQRWGGMGVP